jgi:hypothetical protein
MKCVSFTYITEVIHTVHTLMRHFYLSETKAERKVYLTTNNAHAEQVTRLLSTQKDSYNSTDRQKEQSTTTLVDHVVLRMWLGMWSHASLRWALVCWAVTHSYEIPSVTWKPEAILNLYCIFVFSTPKLAEIRYFHFCKFLCVAQCYMSSNILIVRLSLYSGDPEFHSQSVYQLPWQLFYFFPEMTLPANAEIQPLPVTFLTFCHPLLSFQTYD